jgi:voltage-gated potassium channel
MRSFYALVDLTAITPYYFSHFVSVKLSFTTSLRVLRMFRLIKFDNYTNAFDVITHVFIREHRLLLVGTFYIFSALLICASLLYLIETNTVEFK